jgi:hypothetical protein
MVRKQLHRRFHHHGGIIQEPFARRQCKFSAIILGCVRGPEFGPLCGLVRVLLIHRANHQLQLPAVMPRVADKIADKKLYSLPK